MKDVNNNELHVGDYVKFKHPNAIDFTMSARNGIIIKINQNQNLIEINQYLSDGVVIDEYGDGKIWKIPSNVQLMTDGEIMLYMLEN